MGIKKLSQTLMYMINNLKSIFYIKRNLEGLHDGDVAELLCNGQGSLAGLWIH